MHPARHSQTGVMWSDAAPQRSILDDLGEEVTAIVTPVSVCMALTVALVKTLNPTGASDGRSVFIASAFYTEQAGDSSAHKAFGAIANASVFVVTVTFMTFLLVCLFKRGYTRVIYGYMAFAGFSIFFVLAGILLLQLLEAWQIAMDAFSYLFILYNFAVVGVLSLFVWPAPMTLKQMFLTVTGVIVAYVFTWTPEWTTWTLLLAMAIYDLFAVLMPGGPLKELVQIAEERQVDIPALVYEARAVRRPEAGHHEHADQEPDSRWEPHRARPRRMHNIRPGAAAAQHPATGQQQEEVALMPSSQQPQQHDVEQPDPAVHVEVSAVGGQHMLSLPQHEAASGSEALAPQEPSQRHRPPDNPMLPDAIKLGLGDFIFYSVLVGRAAMYDMMTAFLCYLAIIAGLGATLLLLALHKQALPALPVSITFGIIFYFASRSFLEPFVLPLTTKLVFF